MENLYGRSFLLSFIVYARLYIVLFGVLSITACATVNHDYKEPLQGPRARIRFVNDSDTPAELLAYDKPNCGGNQIYWMDINRKFIFAKPRKLGMPLWNYKEGSAKEYIVEADKQLNAMFVSRVVLGPHKISIGVPFWFTPQEGQDYEVLFDQPNKVTIFRLERSGSGWTRSKLAVFDAGPNESNEGCAERLKTFKPFY